MITDGDVTAWFTGRVPQDWSQSGPIAVSVDDEEIIVTVAIEPPEIDEGSPDSARHQAADGRLAAWRDETRDARIGIAREAQQRFGRTVSWAAAIGDQRRLFTHLAVPAMTRLRQPERRVLDTLVAAGVAKSRADALRWCVTLVGEHTQDWLTQLRSAMTAVDTVRDAGPGV